jgi:predicted ATPase
VLSELLERSSLLAELDGALAATETLGGRIVLVAGEAGIGKSALVREFTGRRNSDIRFLVGLCDPLLTPRALGPMHDIARQLGTGAPPADGIFGWFLNDRPRWS